ncbi:MAG TPA: hypothetical protein VFZ50_02810, partial [Actinomycetota bacterium]|nr:hypothetical protein [Actinomycetota bacterium]
MNRHNLGYWRRQPYLGTGSRSTRDGSVHSTKADAMAAEHDCKERTMNLLGYLNDHLAGAA